MKSFPELTGSNNPEAHSYIVGLSLGKEQSMVDRVAEAIAAARYRDKEVSPKDLALAAIAAMREPTNAMMGAVLDAHDRAPNTTWCIDDWQVAIDAALKD